MAQRHTGRRVKAQGGSRVLRYAGNLQRRHLLLNLRNGRQRRGACAVGADRQITQGLHTVDLALLRLQNHAVLVGLGKNRRHNALAKGAVERVVNAAGADAQARCGVAIHIDISRQTLATRIAGGVAHFGDVMQFRHQLLRPRVYIVGVDAANGQTVLGGTALRINGQILRGLQEDADTRHLTHAIAQALHHVFLHIVRALEVDGQAAGIEHGVIGRIHAHHRTHRLHIFVLQDGTHGLLLQIAHAGK